MPNNRQRVQGNSRNDWSSYDNPNSASEVEVTEPNPGSNEVVTITHIEVKAKAGSTAASDLQILDGSGGTVKWEMEFDEKYGAVVDRSENPIKLTAGNSPYLKASDASSDFNVNLGGSKERA